MTRVMNNKGSLTIETVLVFSTVLLCVSVLISAFMLMYNRVLLLNIAADAAEEFTFSWNENKGLYEQLQAADQVLLQDTVEGTVNMAEKSRQLREELKREPGSNNYWLKSFQARIYQRLATNSLKPQRTTLTIRLNDDFLSNSIQVTISQDIRVPFGKLKAIFGGGETVNISGTASSTILNPAQYIRNIDLSLEYLHRIRNGGEPVKHGGVKE